LFKEKTLLRNGTQPAVIRRKIDLISSDTHSMYSRYFATKHLDMNHRFISQAFRLIPRQTGKSAVNCVDFEAAFQPVIICNLTCWRLVEFATELQTLTKKSIHRVVLNSKPRCHLRCFRPLIWCA